LLPPAASSSIADTVSAAEPEFTKFVT
jgi:hypothetical protein